MGSLICMAVHSTEKNERLKYTNECLQSLMETVDFSIHKLVISDNNSSIETKDAIGCFQYEFGKHFPHENLTVFFNKSNLGTSGAINKAIRLRESGQHIIKTDDDVKWHSKGWVEEMEDAIQRQPLIGVCNLKRNDFGESPFAENPDYRTKLFMLPHQKHQSWIVVEELKGSGMGTCQMINSALLDKIGYYKQIPPYGWDDHLLGVSCTIAGFQNIFLPYIRICHLDTGVTEFGIKTEFIEWKQKVAGEVSGEVAKLIDGYTNGTIPIYFEPNFDELI